MRECPTCGSCLPDDVIHCPTDGAATTRSIAGEPILDGRYHLERRLGSGGMGLVFKARHVFLKTRHAIKIILPDLVGNDPNLATRFRQEALASAAIRHPNIIAVTDFGITADSMPFLVMEFVQGKSLQDIMADEGAMPALRAMELIEPICAGVAAAHRQRIIHRDLKPLNVMIQDGVPISDGLKILDFGLAKIKSGELLGSFVAAQTTGLLGSPHYMAPEQWSDEEADAHADIYSLAVIFYQMLCAEVPFKGSSIASIMKKHLTEKVPPLASKGVEVPPQIEAAIRHALEKEPEHRTASAEDFIGELRTAMATASATLKHPGEALGIDASKTLLAPSENSTTGDVFGRSAFGPLPGTDTVAAPLLEEGQKTAYPAMSGGSAVVDSEATKILPENAHMTAGKNSVVASAARTFPLVDVSLGPKPRKSWLPIVLTLSVVLLIGGGIGVYFVLRSNLFRPSVPSKIVVPEKTSIKPELIKISGGTFQMGRKDGPSTEGPPYTAKVADFAIDKTEVTNAEYELFVRDKGHAPPEHWKGTTPPAGSDRLPVSNVSYEDAVAFAEWRSKRDSVTYRLPTEEEWEYAARNGDKGDLYPWGNTWVNGRAATGVEAAQPVGTYPLGKNERGVLDLIGNVWEWTSSRASLYKGKLPAEYKDWIVVRGAGYTNPGRHLEVSGTLRTWWPPEHKDPVIGFRLVRPGG